LHETGFAFFPNRKAVVMFFLTSDPDRLSGHVAVPSDHFSYRLVGRRVGVRQESRVPGGQ
jgi:hypothetical protein